MTPNERPRDYESFQVRIVHQLGAAKASEAAGLQEDLRRAGIEPFGWVINKCLTASGTHDPLLRLRLARERTQIARVQNGLATRAFIIGAKAKIGLQNLAYNIRRLVALERMAAA
jgi:arsenite-transporting ATPase